MWHGQGDGARVAGQRRKHGAIIDALQDRDARGAVNLLRNHIRSGEKRLVSALEWAVVQA